MVGSLRKTFPQAGTFNPEAVAKVRQRPQKPWMDRAPSAAEISAARASLGAGKSRGDAECPSEFWKGVAEDRSTNALMEGTTAGMWRTGGHTQLDPDSIPDTLPAAPDMSTPALHLARQQG